MRISPEMMIAAELAVGVLRDPPEQQLALDLGRPSRLGQERPGQPSGADFDRRAEQAHERQIQHS